jgi:hypothetical protein
MKERIMRTLPRTLLFVTFIVAVVVGASGPQRDKEPTKPKYPGVFITESNGEPKPLSIKTLRVDVNVTGTLCTTTFDMTVSNPHDRVLEGEFSMPLVEGQTVARFALDINGKLREGVVVSKSKGRETFEEVIRTKVDPALLEWTRDNSFRARIYPIPAKGTRRVVIAYEQQLTSHTNGLTYTLPFAFPHAIEEFSFHCNVAGFGLRPSLTGGDGERIDFSPQGRSYTVTLEEKNITLNKPFSLLVPVALNDHAVVVNTVDDEKFAAMYLRLPVEQGPRPLPRSVALLWDASLSGERREVDVELATLDAFFTRLGSVDLRLVTFSNTVMDDRRMPVRSGNWSDARSIIERTPFDGATQLGLVPLGIEADVIILVSDGISTLGNHRSTISNSPVFVLSTGTPADHDVLASIAQRSGGTVIHPQRADPNEAVNAILGSRRMITSIEVVDGAIDDLRPLAPFNIEEITTVTGRLRGESATVRITSSMNGSDARVDDVTIDARQHHVGGSGIARLWAQEELRRLSADRKHHAEEIASIGQRFTIVTPGTSLIVLERIEDYVRHNIKPPANEPDLMVEWSRRRNQLTSDSVQQWDKHARDVRQLIADRRSRLTTPAMMDTADFNSKRGIIDFFDENSGASVDEVEDEGMYDRVSPSRSQRMAVGVETASGRGAAMAPTLMATAERSSWSKNSDARSTAEAPTATITLATKDQQEAWSKVLTANRGEDVYTVYLQQREKYREVTAFYLDAADRLVEIGDRVRALRVLSNLAELKGEDHRDLRILGHRLLQLGEAALAVAVFKDVQHIRDEEPQSYRDLALALQATGDCDKAVEQFLTVIERPWHARFPEIELIASMELSRLVREHGSKMNVSMIDTTLLLPVACDVRVVLTWDADNCDMDLWVIDPRGETCKYDHRDTRIGGHMSRDLTGGYGPEEFILPKAVSGKYQVKVHYYGSRQQDLARPTTVQVTMFTRYGSGEEKKENVTLRLDGANRVIDVAALAFN